MICQDQRLLLLENALSGVILCTENAIHAYAGHA